MRVACDTFNADLLYEPWETYNSDCRAFTNFDAFWNKARPGTKQSAPPRLAPRAPPLHPVASARTLGSQSLPRASTPCAAAHF